MVIKVLLQMLISKTSGDRDRERESNTKKETERQIHRETHRLAFVVRLILWTYTLMQREFIGTKFKSKIRSHWLFLETWRVMWSRDVEGYLGLTWVEGKTKTIPRSRNGKKQE